MHYRFLVTCSGAAAKNSSQARGYVVLTLHEKGFAGDYGMADWFVIGGRWSGDLSRHSWAALLSAQMDALEHEHGVQVWGVSYGDEERRQRQRELAGRFQDLWNAAAPRAYRDIPIQRDPYEPDGYEDDAMLLSEGLYTALLHEFAGQRESEYHTDLDGDAVSPAMVGRKWLVVVDYHT